MRVIESERVPIFVWGGRIDEQTSAQARNLANLPFAHHHVAIMPDAHVGYGMPIGGVLAAEGEVVPHAVGLDIGCGMRAWPTGVTIGEMGPALETVLARIQRDVPTGFEWHERSQADRTSIFEEMPDAPVLRAEAARAARQLATLGGGNHFIELDVDASGVVWAMVHSGSRNVGKRMAEHYDAIARESTRRAGDVPLEWGLAHLSVESEAGGEYLAVMDWCLRFARENRRLIAEAVQAAIQRDFPDALPGRAIDVHHNYAAIEEHFGRSVVVHRKGAVRAEGAVVVPGSMGTASYLAEGTGDERSFRSCSHGAGRAMGRKQALRELPRESVLADLERRGVRLMQARKRDVAEEAPAAYKDIERVMEEQRDLVTPTQRLVPIGVVKG